MIWKGYSILDVRSDLWSRPFFLAARGEAIRTFTDLANDVKTSIGSHPKDYKLVEVCTFDDQKGEVLFCEPVPLGLADEYVKRTLSIA